MLKVLLVSPLPPPAGGIATWTRIIQERGMPEDISVHLVNTTVGDAKQVFDNRILAGGYHQITRWLRIIGQVFKALRRERFNIVHLNIDALQLGVVRDLLCAIIARAFNAKVLVHYRGNVAELERSGDYGYLQKKLVQMLGAIAKVNIALNIPSHEYLCGSLGDNADSVFTLANFFDEREIEANPDWDRRSGDKVLFVGAVTGGKGADVVVECAGRLPEIEFHLVGRVYPDVEPLLAQAGGNIRKHSEQSHGFVLAQMRSADVLLFPTLREGFPNVVCEAMASGLAVVASAVGAIPEMIDDGIGGVLLKERSADDAVAVLSALIGDRERVRAMAEHNHAKAWNEYSYPRVIEKLSEIYRAM